MPAKIPTYILMGQSNMDGRGFWPLWSEGQNGTLAAEFQLGGLNPDAITFFKSAFALGDNGAWAALHEFVNNAHPVNVLDQVFGPEMAFMKKMAEFKAKKVALIKCAKGGSGVNVDMANGVSWHVPNNGLCYELGIEYIQQGLEKLSQQGIPEVKALVFYLGWSDSDTDQHVTDFQTNVTATLSGFRAQLTERNAGFADVPFYVVQSPQRWVTEGMRTATRYNGLEAAKVAAAAADANIFYFQEPVGGYALHESVHLTGDEYSQLGTDLFQLLKDL